ncbi:MAG: hypothetical protein ACRD0Y_09645 [Terriglobales bacterium]
MRARWDDGSYGLRCSRCMAAYAHTWEDVIEAPSAASTLAALPSPAPTAGGDLDRAA